MQDVQGAKGGRGGRGVSGVKGEKGIQDDNSDVLGVLAEHVEKMCFIKYHVSEDRSSIVELAGSVVRYVVLARTTNPRVILMLNLSMVKDMKWHMYRKRLVMVIFKR